MNYNELAVLLVDFRFTKCIGCKHLRLMVLRFSQHEYLNETHIQFLLGVTPLG